MIFWSLAFNLYKHLSPLLFPVTMDRQTLITNIQQHLSLMETHELEALWRNIQARNGSAPLSSSNSAPSVGEEAMSKEEFFKKLRGY